MTSVVEMHKRIMIERFSNDGIVCPCCEQLAKVYERRLYHNMVDVLFKMYRLDNETPGRWIKIGAKGDIQNTTGGDYAKMRFWGMIESQDAIRDDGSTRAGIWRITSVGRDFIENKIRIPRVILTYNNQGVVRDGDQDTVSILEIDKDFDFRKIVSTETR